MSVDRDRGKRTNVVAVLNERHDFSVDGVEIRRAVLTLEEMDNIKAEVSVDHEILRRTGIRNLEKKFSSIARVAASPPVLSVAASLLGKAPLLVRALFFDKTPQRNWFVAWHQDRTVTLNRLEYSSYESRHNLAANSKDARTTARNRCCAGEEANRLRN